MTDDGGVTDGGEVTDGDEVTDGGGETDWVKALDVIFLISKYSMY